MSDENLITIKVNGEEQQLTLEKVVELAQKGVGAEKRFEEAALLRKQADSFLGENREKLKAYELLQRVRSGDPDAQRLLAKEIMGVDDDGLDSYLENIQKQFSTGGVASEGKGGDNQGVSNTAQLPPEVMQTLQAFQQFAKPLLNKGYSMEQVGQILGTGISKQGESNRMTLLRQAAGKSEKLRAAMKGDSDWVMKVINGFARERQGSGELTDEHIQQAIQDAESGLVKLGTGNSGLNSDIAIGDLGATLGQSYSEPKRNNLPNFFENREGADQGMSKLIAELARGGADGSSDT